MNGAETDAELTKLRQVIWKSNLSRITEEFSIIISNDEVFEKYFGESYVERLAIKSRETTRTVLKLGVVYTIIMLSLFASQNNSESEFEIFGYGFKNLGNYKEFLLFLAASLAPISAVLMSYQQYINALMGECLRKLSPDAGVRKFYSYTFLDEYMDGLSIGKRGPLKHGHPLAFVLIFAFILTLIILIGTFVVTSFFIQIIVIYDVITKPASSQYINYFVVSFSIASMLFSWIVSILQLPMPEVDFSNYSKLDKIKNDNPEKYRTLLRTIARENSRKEAISLVILATCIYITSFTIISVYWFSMALDDLSFFLGKALPGAFIVLFLSYIIMVFLRKNMLRWFFSKYPEESQYRIVIFGRVQKFLLLSRFFVPSILSVTYAIYSLSSS